MLAQVNTRHRGQRVTIVGVPADGLLALTGYGTSGPHLLGLITVLKRDGHYTYRLRGHDEDLPDLDTAAAAQATQRSASDLPPA